jgi:anaerobic magnesium-protoporphyrin IX monomethyl ester cyclase
MNVLVLNPPSKYAKNVVRDLIYGCWCKGKRIGGTKAPPLNLLYVATVLKENGHNVKLLDALAEQKDLTAVRKLAKKADVLIISTSNMSFNEDMEVLTELKKENQKLFTISFGSHVTFMPDSILNTKALDVGVMYEAEFVIRDIVNAINEGKSWKEVKGMCYKEGEKVIVNEQYPFIQDLDELPIPDRSFLPKKIDYFNPIVKKVPYTTAMTSRGCPSLCTFCNVPTFYGSKIRARSAENVIKEIEQIISLGYKEIWFRDELFTVYKKRNEEICNYIIENKLKISWIANGKTNMITKEQMALMKKAGCHMIKFGVESGVQKVLNEVKKGTTVENHRKVFKWSQEVGIDTHAHMMLGMPGDTKETVEETIRFVKEIAPTTVTFGICTPYAGTPLFNHVKEVFPEIADGSCIDLKTLHTDARYNQYYTQLDSEELNKYVRKAYRSFYFRPSYLFKWLTRIRSMDELRRVILAGTQVFSFSVGKE